MKGFYEIVIKDGKEAKVPYKWAAGQYEKYKSVCETIWGGLPLDVNWAINTDIFKKALLNSEQNPERSVATKLNQGTKVDNKKTKNNGK